MAPSTPKTNHPTQLERRNRELSILTEIAQALNREVDLPRALAAALSQVARLLDLDTGWIWLLAEETGESYLAASQNLPPALGNFPDRMAGSCYCLDTFRGGDMNGAANLNMITCSRLKWIQDGTQGLKYHASIPLYHGAQKLGVLNLASTGWRELSAEDLQLLSTVGDMLAIAITRARLFGKSIELGALTERNRLAREIHDTLAQGLAAITLRLETADVLLGDLDSNNAARSQLQDALSLTRTLLDEARRSVLDLRAAPLEGKSLATAIADLVSETSEDSKIEISFQSLGDGLRVPTYVEVGLFRIAQEALANLARHSSASHGSVLLENSSEAIGLRIQDNGKGFLGTEVPPDRFGLVGMKERTQLLNGKIQIRTQPGEGTIISVLIPLND